MSEKYDVPTPAVIQASLARWRATKGLHAAMLREVEAATRKKALEAAVKVVEDEVNSYIPKKPRMLPDMTPAHVCRSRLSEKIRALAGEASK